MAEIKNGVLVDPTVENVTIGNIEHGLVDLKNIKAIIIHQTNTFAVKGTINGYRNSKGKARVGAHFLVDRGGTEEFPESVEDPPKSDKGRYTGKKFTYGGTYGGIDGKIYQTARVNQICWHAGTLRDKKYPNNRNSLGIEFISRYDYAKQLYPPPSQGQIQSGAWLVKALLENITSIPAMQGVYAHGVIAFKTADMSEGGTTLQKINEQINSENIKVESSCSEIIQRLFPYLCQPLQIKK